MPITIEDISAQLGLSVSTVSKAMNNYPDISKDTRDRVLNAARELGYHPNAAARNLRRKRTDKIGLIINTPMAYISESLFSLFPSMATVLEQSSANLILYTSGIKDPKAELLKICQSREVDGIILYWSEDIREAVNILEDEAFPYVIMDRRVAHPNASYVVKDNYQGAYELTSHLLSLGYTDIGFMTRPIHGSTNLDRLGGYKHALAEAEIPFRSKLVVPTKIEPRSGYQEMLKFLDMDEPPKAVIAFHDLVAVRALEAIQDRGLHIPEDVAIASFDNLRSSRMTNPIITTVGYSLEEMGKLVMESLFNRIDDGEGKPIQITIPTELIVRPSTDPTIEVSAKNYVKKNL